MKIEELLIESYRARLEKIKQEMLIYIENIEDSKELEEFRKVTIGKKGMITEFQREMGKIMKKQKLEILEII